MIDKELLDIHDALQLAYPFDEAIYVTLVKLIDIVRRQQAKIESLEKKIALLVYSE